MKKILTALLLLALAGLATADTYYESGNIKEKVRYVDGKITGIVISYYESGIVKEEKFYNDGEPNGYAKQYYPDGTLSFDGLYRQGLLNGTARFYDAGGKLYRETLYSMGTPVNSAIYENNTLLAEFKYNSGEITEGYYMIDGKKVVMSQQEAVEFNRVSELRAIEGLNYYNSTESQYYMG